MNKQPPRKMEIEMELDLNELELLANAAAPGPWRRQDFY